MRLREVVAWLRAWLCAVVIFGAASTAADGAGILVREELGFGFVPSGIEFVLEENGPAAIYDLSSQFGEGAIFNLRYADDFFVMTALADNTVADAGSLPFGIDIYPGNVDPITPEFDCALTTPCYNGIDFFPWFTFPMLAGQVLSLRVDAPVAVAEPASWALAGMALVLLAWTRLRQRVVIPSRRRGISAHRRAEIQRRFARSG